MRDMSVAQFVEALLSHGMKSQGFMGYVDLGIPGRTVCVSYLNAGENRRDRLAYLIREQERRMAVEEQP